MIGFEPRPDFAAMSDAEVRAHAIETLGQERYAELATQAKLLGMPLEEMVRQSAIDRDEAAIKDNERQVLATFFPPPGTTKFEA